MDRTFGLVTVVGNLYGDSAAFTNDVKSAVIGELDVIVYRRTVRINGNHEHKIKQWLVSLGF